MTLGRLGPALLAWRGRRPRVVDWRDGPLLVMPGILDPVATKVGAWLAEAVAGQVRPGERWLDMGCGTGIVGLALATAGARVTCADIDPRAARNAAANARLRGVEVEAVESDLFSSLGGRRFDRVVYNVPFWPGDPAGRPFGRAMYAGPEFEAIHAFVRAFPPHAPEALVALSENGGDFAGARRALGPRARLRRRAFVRGEWLDLYVL